MSLEAGLDGLLGGLGAEGQRAKEHGGYCGDANGTADSSTGVHLGGLYAGVGRVPTIFCALTCGCG